MTRVDLYGMVHKGLRTTLFETAERVARTDFSLPGELPPVVLALDRLFAFLEEHAEHEEAVIGPTLKRLAPTLASELANDHARLHGLQDELRSFGQRLADASDAERLALGQRIHERMCRLVAAHLLHLDQEETRVNRMLWAHLDDEALRELEAQILRSIPGPRLAEWLELILPASNATEQRNLLDGMRASVPEPAFRELTAKARDAMGHAVFERRLAESSAEDLP